MKKSKEVKMILHIADVEADMNNDQNISPAYIAIAMLTSDENIVTTLLKMKGVNIDKLYEDIMKLYFEKQNISLIIKKPTNRLPDRDCRDILLKTELIALATKNDEIKLEHLFFAMLACDNSLNTIFKEYNIDAKGISTLFSEINKMDIDKYQENTNLKHMDNEDYEDLNGGIIEPKVGIRKNSKTPALDEFGEDITAMAANGKIERIFGREDETSRMVQILTRKTKKNPVIVGEPGVGKSALVEALALMIVEKTAPKTLWDKKIISIDLSNIVAGTKYRGQFESRMKTIILELKNNPNVILFIDEIHTLVGAGASTGSLDASNILKPALAKGEIQVIGSTTLKEFKDHIEKDGALSRRLQKILLNEPSLVETKLILRKIKDSYQAYHNVTYSDEIIDACADLANRYIQDKFMPDKAIDILDEAGSATKNLLAETPKNILHIEQKIRKIVDEDLKALEVEKKQAIKSSDFEAASKIRDIETEVVATLNKLKDKLHIKKGEIKTEVTIDIVNKVVSTMSGVPVEKLTVKEANNILNIEKVLNKKVIGQANAINRVSKTIIRDKSGVKDPNKPSVFMFLGPTGVGKTLLAKEIAETVYGNSKSLIRIDMSEYGEKMAVNNLIGTSQGFVGYGDGGKLTEAVKQKPYSVVLLDEIEKAHPDTFNIFLQLFDEGRITDGNNRLIDFKNTTIIMTSNVGVKELNKGGSLLGFSTKPNDEAEISKSEKIIKDALKKKFPPEFLNRIGETIIFEKLNQVDLKQIVKLEIGKLDARMNDLGFKVKFTPALINYLCEKGFDPEYGARPLQRVIETEVMVVLGERIIRNPENKEITITYDEKESSVVIV